MLGIARKTGRDLNFVLAWPAKIAGGAKREVFLAALARLEAGNFMAAAQTPLKALGN